MKCLSILFFQILLTRCHSTLFPEDGGMAFKYHATIQNTISSPEKYTSHYDISAIVHVWYNETSNIVVLHNVTTSDLMGRHVDIMSVVLENGKQETGRQEINYLLMPFEIHYFDNGTIDYLDMSVHDTLWSIIIKKSIASLFHLDYGNIKRTAEGNGKYNFMSHEQTLSGELETRYYVNKMEDQFSITKTFEECKDKWYVYSSIDSNITPEDLGKINKHVNYNLTYRDNKFKVTSIYSNWNLLFYAENSDDSIHSISVNQVIESMGSIHGTVEKNKQVKKYSLFDDKDIYTSLITMAGMNCDVDTIHDLLQGMTDYMNNGHVSFETNDWQQTNLFRQLISYLRTIEKECFSILIDKLKSSSDESAYNLFMHILPFIGTKTSSLFIYEIIREQKLTLHFSRMCLKIFPFYIKFMPDKEILEKFSTILLWDVNIYTESIIKAGVLAFSTMISKASHDAKPYVDKLIDIFNSCDIYECKLFYIYVLSNTQSSEIMRVMDPIINKSYNVTVETTLRNVAMWVALDGKPDLVQQICWPILLDNSEDLEMRIYALQMLMLDKSIGNLMKLEFSLREDIKDQHLYSVFYTMLLSENQNIQSNNDLEKKHIESVLQFINKPKFTSDNVYESYYNYYNDDLNLGATIKVSVFNRLLEEGIYGYYVEFNSHFPQQTINNIAIRFRLEVNKNVRKKIAPLLKMNLIELISEIQHIYKDIIEDAIQLEFTIFFRNQAIETVTYNKIKDLIQDIYNFYENKNYIEYIFSIWTERMALTLTDIGTPIVNYFSEPTLVKLKSDVNKNSGMTIKIEKHMWSTRLNEVRILNPITSAWYGSRKQVQTDIRLPVHIKIGKRNGQQYIKFILKDKTDFFSRGNTGFQSGIQSQVYIFNETTKTNQADLSVTKLLPKRQDSLWNINMGDIGAIYNVAIFDCEHVVSPGYVNNFKKDTINTLTSLFNVSEFWEFVLKIKEFWTYAISIPRFESCGFGIQKNNSNNATDITIAYKQMINENDNKKVTIDFALNEDDHIITAWNAECISKIVGINKPENNCTITKINNNHQEYKIYLKMKIMKINNTATCDIMIHQENNIEPTLISIYLKRSKSKEQKENNQLSYTVCESNEHTLDCISARSLLLKDEFTVTYRNVNGSYVIDNILNIYNSYFKKIYKGYYQIQSNIGELDEGLIKAIVNFNVATEDIDIMVKGPFKTFAYIGIPNEECLDMPYFIRLKSTVINDGESLCKISKDNYINQYNEIVSVDLTEKYELFSNTGIQIFVKVLNDKLHLRYKVDENNTLEVNGHRYTLNVEYNGKEILVHPEDDSNKMIGQVEYKILDPYGLIIMDPNKVTTVVTFTPNTIHIYAPRHTSYTGYCHQ